jgi:protein phosphatase
VVAAIAVVALLAGFFAFRGWLDSRWYVGITDDDLVAVYQGIPAQVLGYDLSHVEVTTNISGEEATATGFHPGLNEGINVGSREEATLLIQQIRDDVRRARSGGAST